LILEDTSTFFLQILPKYSKSLPMTATERQKRIEEYLQRAEFASLEELSAHVQASISTVRRDLTSLESSGN
jgi:predicted DNA-binding transcriptional regulator YafY